MSYLTKWLPIPDLPKLQEIEKNEFSYYFNYILRKLLLQQ